MSANLTTFLIMAVSFLAAVTMVLGSIWLRSRTKRAELTRLAAGDAERLAALLDENEKLRGRIGHQEARLQVLERIATDPAERTAAQIDALRHA